MKGCHLEDGLPTLSSDLYGTWKLEVDGRTVAEGELPTLHTSPQSEETLNLDLPSLEFARGEEAFLTLAFAQQVLY